MKNNIQSTYNELIYYVECLTEEYEEYSSTNCDKHQVLCSNEMIHHTDVIIDLARKLKNKIDEEN